MPVHGSRIGHLVVDRDSDSVMLVDFNQGTRKLIVDKQHWPPYTIRIQFRLSESPIVLPDSRGSFIVPGGIKQVLVLSRRARTLGRLSYIRGFRLVL